MSGLEVVPPHGPRFAAAIDPESHAFLDPIGSLGVRNEVAKLIAIRGHRRPSGMIAL